MSAILSKLPTRCPLALIFPEMVRFLPLILADKKLRSVVFPDPEGPIIAVNLPFLTEPEILLMIVLVSMKAFCFPLTIRFFLVFASILRFSHDRLIFLICLAEKTPFGDFGLLGSPESEFATSSIC